jgi:hypothetical protein
MIDMGFNVSKIDTYQWPTCRQPIYHRSQCGRCGLLVVESVLHAAWITVEIGKSFTEATAVAILRYLGGGRGESLDVTSRCRFSLPKRFQAGV